MQDEDALGRLLAGRLPIPNRDRFQPLRISLYGIWEYDEQEFFFHDGRLILRGHNGSGKTKVLEVSSPFLFDGELTARRLDPFGNAARSMRDNLLYGGLRHRVGYICCEYGRVDHDGQERYLTIGAGLNALASRAGAPESWFFVTPLRVGQEFSLYDAGRNAHSKTDLKKILGDTAVVSTATEYRAKVARELFGFSPGRLRSLVELLLALRRPKLSEDFDVDKLQRLLRDGLPPVNGRLLDDFASRFDVLARDREELDDLREIQRNVSDFLTVYRVFARRAVRAAAEAVTRADARLTASSEELGRAEKEYKRLLGEEKGLKEKKKSLEDDRQAERARLAELELRPEMAEHGRLEELREQVNAASGREEAARTATKQADDVHQGHLRKSSDLARNLQATLVELERYELSSRKLSESTALADAHQAETISLRDDPQAVELSLVAQVEARAKLITDALPLVERVSSAQKEHRIRKELHEDAESRRDQARRQRGALAEDHATRVNRLIARIATWSAACSELQLTEEQIGALQDAARAAGEPGVRPVSTIVAEFARPFEAAIAQDDANARADRERTALQRAELVVERARVATGPDPEPVPPAVVRRDRAEAKDGAPFWAVVDFRPDLDADVAARVEAALLGAGLLNAWVTEDGSLLTEDHVHDAIALPSDSSRGSLTEVLLAVRHPNVSQEHVERLLASISYAPDTVAEGTTTAIGGDGSWRIGVVHGRTTADHAAFIGAAARTAERQRRLITLDRELAELANRTEVIDHTIAELARRSSVLDGEWSDEDLDAADAEVRSALAALTATEGVLSELEGELERVATVLREHAAKLTGAETELADYARAKRIPTRADALLAEHEALQVYRASLPALFREATKWSTLRQNGVEAGEEANGSATLLEQLQKNLDLAEGELRSLQTKRDQRMALVDADVTAILEEVEAAKKAISDHDASVVLISEQIVRTAAKLGKSEGAAEDAKRDRDDRSVARGDAATAYQSLVRQGLVDLALGVSSETVTEQDVVRFLAAEEWHEKARNLARDDVDKQFRLLETALSGPDWQPRSVNDGGVVLVRLVHNSMPVDVPDALSRIDSEISTRMGFIDEEEHDLFRQVLLGRVGEHLRRRRVEASKLIERMNLLLGARRTASGMRFEVIWESDPDQDPEVRAALQTLDRQAAEYLPDEARDQLIAFLVKLVADARTRRDATDWKTSLREVLDYRSWGRIRIRYQSATGHPWTNLTNHTHQLGSGGEKAVSLQLPLFVAAAAHYAGAASSAPRPVYLDEAFAGIDQHMRGECMGLLADLDLDLVLASHDEFGFHPEVPGVATYELFRDPEVSGVLTTPLLWDGLRRYGLRDPALVPDAFDSVGTLFEDEDDDDWEGSADDADPEA